MNKLLRSVLFAIAIIAIVTPSAKANSAKSTDSIQFEVKPFLQIERKISKVNVVLGDSEFTKREQAKKVALASTSRNAIVPRERPVEMDYDLATLRRMYQEVASRYNISWQLVEAVHQVETGKSSKCEVSSAGARGQFQFMPSTFAHYSRPGGNICDLSDSMNAAANLLASSGADRGDIDSALLSYNHSRSYVNLVISVMNSI